MKSAGLKGGWPSSSENWQNWNARLAQAAVQPGLGRGPDAALIHGIACYRRHPWSRDVVEPEPVWQEGETRLLDYSVGASDAPPLLLVPSLVNRASILDLSASRSMARALAAAGLRVFLLDWGWPDEAACRLDLDGLVTGRMARAMDAMGSPVTLVGYCMGGLLTLAAAQLRPELVAGLALLATPWDFHAGREDGELAMIRLVETLEPAMRLSGTLPIDMLQMLFNLGDPHGVGDKYRAFGATVQDSDRARQFVAIEDWLNDGVPLAAPVARQCLGEWYGANVTMRGQWRVAGQAIAPQTLGMPSFLAIPGRDRIVPAESALPLATLMPGATVIRPSAGHVGMVAGATAEAQLWRPLAQWAGGLQAAIRPGFRAKARRRKLPA